MNEIMMYTFRENNVRVEMNNNEPWFVAKDIADVLEYSDTNAMTRHLDLDEIMTVQLTGMTMRSTLVSESGMYSAVLKSRKPEAREFKRWITKEVLPSIRKTGSYQQPMTQMEMIAHMSQSIVDNERRMQVYETKMEDTETKVNELIDTMRIDGVHAHMLNKKGKVKVVGILGGCNTPAYKELKNKLFARMWRDFKNHFLLPRYDELPKSKYNQAVKFISMWQPDTSTRIEIEEFNRNSLED